MEHRALATILVLVAACGGKAAPAAGGGGVVADEPPPCTAETAAGSWRTVTGADFEEITLEADGTFASHLHARPFLAGTWTLADGVLVLAADGDTTIRIDGPGCASQLTGTTDGQAVAWTRL
jgi:hypothetical protein